MAVCGLPSTSGLSGAFVPQSQGLGRRKSLSLEKQRLELLHYGYRSFRRECQKYVLQTAPGSTVTTSGRKTGRWEAAQVKTKKKVAVGKEGTRTAQNTDQRYFNITGFPFPLRPFLTRRTIRYEVEPGIWTFEQEQGLGFSNVTTNIRMTAIRLRSGGLWIHAPIAPTAECIQLVKELGLPVEHIVLPTFAYEHKIFVGPFSRRFPKARVWAAPFQWSWPVNLPLPFFGVFNAQPLVSDDVTVPWADELAQKVLAADVGIGPYVEVAFFHKRTRTLLVTDACIYIPERAPEIVRTEALLESAENGYLVRVINKGREIPDVEVRDTDAFRRKGWQRMVLLILFFQPANLLDPERSFEALAKRLIVSPVVRTLVFSKAPEKVQAWVEDIVASWNFKRIIPCHFAGPISASPQDFKAAFSFLYGTEAISSRPFPFSLPLLSGATNKSVLEADMKTLDDLNSFLFSLKLVSRK